MEKGTPKFINHCNHPEKDFLGHFDGVDMYLSQIDGDDWRVCLRDGDEGGDYIGSFGISAFLNNHSRDYPECSAALQDFIAEDFIFVVNVKSFGYPNYPTTKGLFRSAEDAQKERDRLDSECRVFGDSFHVESMRIN